MQSIGEQLEETRKRLGLSLREASEATKIRSDYLQNMENGEFSFRLPEVYKRGFLKIYARYLKLDADKLAADYNSQFLAMSRMTGGTSGGENLGRVEAQGDGQTTAEPQAFPGAPADRLDTGAGDPGREAIVKFSAVVVVVIVVIVALFVAIEHKIKSTDTPGEPKSSATAQNNPVTPPPSLPAVEMVFSAEDDISDLTVRQASDRAQLFKGPLLRGLSAPVTSHGRVEITVTSAQFLDIEQNGKKTAPGDATGKRLNGPQSFYWPPGSP